MLRNLLILLAIPVLGIAACGDNAAPDAQAPAGKIAVTGMVLNDAGLAATSSEDDGKGCPPAISPLEGSQVFFEDGSGNTVGLATLGSSQKVYKSDPPAPDENGAYPIYCGHPFKVEVNTADFYTVKVSGWDGEARYTTDDLQGPLNLVLD